MEKKIIFNGKEILIGTSGYSFKDWVGTFYPEGIKQGKMLNYYAKIFPVVEINSTYYRVPHQKVFHHLEQKTPPGFEFFVKLHKSATHLRRNYQEELNTLKENIKPLQETNKFRGYLAQFPYSFKNQKENRYYLRQLRQEIEPEIPLFIEFRHQSWINRLVYQFLQEQNIGYVCVDEPQLPGLIPPQSISTNGVGYIRFHGRNSTNWWHPVAGDRYDYLYSAEELLEWKGRITEMLDQVSRIYLFFNNCHHGKAARNAMEMFEILQ